MKSRENKRIIRTIIFILFVLSYILVAISHEPWFDEAQAWQIGRSATLSEQLFILPHYEGHPAFWSFMLGFIGRTNIPFEVGLKTIGLIISASVAYMILFRSPYPWYIRYSLPFSYFVFYQYGIIVRPYGLTFLVLLILALLYKSREKKPYRYAALLFLLSLTSAFGIIIAGGIALCLVIDIIREKGFINSMGQVLSDPRERALVVLFVITIGLICSILPRADTVITSAHPTNSFFVRLICTLFTILGDCVLTKSEWFFFERMLLQTAKIPLFSLIPCILVGLLIWLFLFCLCSRKNLKYLLIPYTFFALFAAVAHLNSHHIGLGLGIALFWTWIALEDDYIFWGYKIFKKKLLKREREQKFFNGLVFFFFCSSIGISLYWTISSSMMDIRKKYSYGRKTVEYLKKNQLDNLIIFSAWQIDYKEVDGEKKQKHYTNIMGAPVPILAYYDHNIVANFNHGDDNKAFMYWKESDEVDNKTVFEEWETYGLPDVLLGTMDLSLIFDDIDISKEYTIVYLMNINYIWKGSCEQSYIPLCVRNDIFQSHHLEPLKKSDDYLPDIFYITDEQRELYERGELTLEDIIPFITKPEDLEQISERRKDDLE